MSGNINLSNSLTKNIINSFRVKFVKIIWLLAILAILLYLLSYYLKSSLLAYIAISISVIELYLLERNVKKNKMGDAKINKDGAKENL